MKILENTFDKEVWFDDLEKAKKYYFDTWNDADAEDCKLDEAEAAEIAENVKEYNAELEAAETLEEVADVLNSYTDILGNGTSYRVREI